MEYSDHAEIRASADALALGPAAVVASGLGAGPAGAVSGWPLACPASAVPDSPHLRCAQVLRRASAHRHPGRSAPVPPGQRLEPHAWRHLRRAGLTGPAKPRRACAEQNAPLLLFFRRWPRPLSRLATRAWLFLVVLPCVLLPRFFC